MVTGKGCLCFFCIRFCYIHVNWWLSFFRWRYEGEPHNPLIHYTSTQMYMHAYSITYMFTKVFQRERLNGHYGVTAFVISNTLSAMPFLIMITFISGTICYFMVRLHPGLSHYVFFVLCLYASVTVVESLMMAIASIIPNFLMGIIIGAGIQVCFYI